MKGNLVVEFLNNFNDSADKQELDNALGEASVLIKSEFSPVDIFLLFALICEFPASFNMGFQISFFLINECYRDGGFKELFERVDQLTPLG